MLFICYVKVLRKEGKWFEVKPCDKNEQRNERNGFVTLKSYFDIICG